MSDVDGRTLRRARNSATVVDALLDLVRDGVERPTAAEIARRAGVSERTVFRHFDDLESLLQSAAARQLERLAPWLESPAPTGAVADRIVAVIDHRAEVFELIGPVRRAVLRTATVRPAVLAGPEEVDRRLRDHVARAFAEELRSVRRIADRQVLRHALEVTTSWPTWSALRGDLGLEVEESKRVVRTLLEALVTSPAGRAAS